MANRRDLLKGALIIPFAPAIVKAENIMRIFVPQIITFDEFYEGTFIPDLVGCGEGLYDKTVGRYTRIGNKVFIHMHILGIKSSSTYPYWK